MLLQKIYQPIVEFKACVAMTGCIGEEDVEFTILSTHATNSPMFKWTKEGKVEVVEKSNEVKRLIDLFKLELPNQFYIFFSLLQENLHGYRDMLRVPRKTAKDSDELIIDEVETAILNAEKKCKKGKCTLPETQHLQIRVNI